MELNSYFWWHNWSTACWQSHYRRHRSVSYQQSWLPFSVRLTVTQSHTPALRQGHLSCSYRAENRWCTTTRASLNMSLSASPHPFLSGDGALYLLTYTSPCGHVDYCLVTPYCSLNDICLVAANIYEKVLCVRSIYNYSISMHMCVYRWFLGIFKVDFFL